VFEPFFIPTTVNAPFEIWMDIMTKKADGQQLFMEKKYTVEGDLALLMQMDHLFGQK
jgi:putative sterol carrier protein